MGDVKTKPRATLAVAVLLLAACGPVANQAAKPPTASEILNKPDQANVKDAHFTLVAHIVSAGVAFDATGDGVIVVKPAQASKFTMTTTVFFSSRRRHTRLQGDWSSDVCSSD